MLQFQFLLDPLVAQMVKNLPAMQVTQVWSLGRKDHMKKGVNSLNRGALRATVHGGGKESDTTAWLTLSLSCHNVEKNIFFISSFSFPMYFILVKIQNLEKNSPNFSISFFSPFMQISLTSKFKIGRCIWRFYNSWLSTCMLQLFFIKQNHHFFSTCC